MLRNDDRVENFSNSLKSIFCRKKEYSIKSFFCQFLQIDDFITFNILFSDMLQSSNIRINPSLLETTLIIVKESIERVCNKFVIHSSSFNRSERNVAAIKREGGVKKKPTHCPAIPYEGS